MIKQTTWRPDTCECVIIYEWDTDVSEDERVHTPIATTFCTHHMSLTREACFAKVTLENTTKNIILDDVQKQIPSLPMEELTWGFDENREFFIDTSKIDSQTALQVDNIVNALKDK